MIKFVLVVEHFGDDHHCGGSGKYYSALDNSGGKRFEGTVRFWDSSVVFWLEFHRICYDCWQNVTGDVKAILLNGKSIKVPRKTWNRWLCCWTDNTSEFKTGKIQIIWWCYLKESCPHFSNLVHRTKSVDPTHSSPLNVLFAGSPVDWVNITMCVSHLLPWVLSGHQSIQNNTEVFLALSFYIFSWLHG